MKLEMSTGIEELLKPQEVNNGADLNIPSFDEWFRGWINKLLTEFLLPAIEGAIPGLLFIIFSIILSSLILKFYIRIIKNSFPLFFEEVERQIKTIKGKNRDNGNEVLKIEKPKIKSNTIIEVPDSLIKSKLNLDLPKLIELRNNLKFTKNLKVENKILEEFYSQFDQMRINDLTYEQLLSLDGELTNCSFVIQELTNLIKLNERNKDHKLILEALGVIIESMAKANSRLNNEIQAPLAEEIAIYKRLN